MQVGTGCSTGRTDKPDDVAASHALSGGDGEAGKMTEARLDAEAVVEEDAVAVVTVVAGRFDHAVGGGANGRAFVGGDIETRMIVGAARERILAAAEAGRQPARNW